MFAVRRGDGVVGVARAFAFALDCFSPASLRGSRASAAFALARSAACLGALGESIEGLREASRGYIFLAFLA